MEFVARLGRSPEQVARRLIGRISEAQVRDWSAGTPEDWARQSFEIAKDHVYKLPQPNARDSVHLDAAYIKGANDVAASQLSRAGVRLAYLINRALSQLP